MKFLTTAIIGAFLVAPTATLAQSTDDDSGLNFSLSAGVISTPNFLGDDEQQIIGFPNLTVSYGDRFTASIDGVRYTVFSQNGLSLGVVGAYHFGRGENPDDEPLVIDGGETSDLVGLGDIDGTIELGGYIEYEYQRFSTRMEVRQGVDGGHDGIYGEVEAKYNGSIDDFGTPVFISVGPSVAFGDEAYNSTFFDVNAAQSAASGISQYDADGGLISIGLHAAAAMPLTDSTTLVGFANYDQLAGDVGDSTIVDERGSKDQVTAGLLVNYTF